MKSDRLQLCSDEALPPAAVLLRDQLSQHSIPLPRNLDRHMVRHLCRRSTRTGGIGEDMQIRERQTLDKAHVFLEQYFILAVESHHHVSAARRIRHGFTELAD